MDFMSPLLSVYVMSDCFTYRYRRRDRSDVVLGLYQISYSMSGIGEGIMRHSVPGSMVCSSLIDRAFFVWYEGVVALVICVLR